MKMLKTKCPICNSEEEYAVIYKSNFDPLDLNPEIFSARRIPDLVHYQIVKCKNDKLVRSNPVCADVCSDDLYRKSKLNYVDQTGNLTISYLEALDKIFPNLSQDAKILEIGCGNGFMLKALWDKGYKNLYGVEPSQDAVLKADERFKDRIIADVLKEGLYEDRSFDLIFFFQTIDHVSDPIGFLTKCYNLLSPGGYILAITHDIESFSAKILGEKSPIIDIEHTCLYSKETIRKVFTKAGFTPLEIYSPKNVISFKYLIWLLPLSKPIKLKLLNLKGRAANFILNQRIKISLGNLCIIAKKTVGDRR